MIKIALRGHDSENNTSTDTGTTDMINLTGV